MTNKNYTENRPTVAFIIIKHARRERFENKQIHRPKYIDTECVLCICSNVAQNMTNYM